MIKHVLSMFLACTGSWVQILAEREGKGGRKRRGRGGRKGEERRGKGRGEKGRRRSVVTELI